MTELRIDSLFHPATVEEFQKEYFGSRVYHASGDSGRFREYFNWRELNTVLTFNRWQYPRFRLVKDGRDLRPDTYSFQGPSGLDYMRLTSRQVSEHLRDGASLVVDGLDELVPSVRSLAQAFESEFGEYAKVNAYASWTQEPGFDQHWDDHDVVILQIAGSKLWKIFGESRNVPMRRDVEANLNPPDVEPLELVLTAGDLLYVPRGHWHSVQTVLGPSLHLTVGITQSAVVDYLHWIVDLLLRDEWARRSLPKNVSGGSEAYLADIIEKFSTKARSNSISDFLAYKGSTSLVRQEFSFPEIRREAIAQLPEESILSWLPTRFVLHDVNNSVIVEADGQRWTFAIDAYSTLVVLAKSRCLTIKTLLEGAPEREAQTRFLVADLVAEGLIAVQRA